VVELLRSDALAGKETAPLVILNGEALYHLPQREIMEALEIQYVPLLLRQLTHVAPLLPPSSATLFEHTIPDLNCRAMSALRKHISDEGQVYSAAQTTNHPTEAWYLEALVAAQLVSRLYSHFLDPLRFAGNDGSKPDWEAIFAGFARTLSGVRVLPSVEMLTVHLPALRVLDEYQPGIGTNAARWMQYLAYEVLTSTWAHRGYTTGRASDRLGVALHDIRGSATIPDRFKSLTPQHE
jgi:hypothetical protein